MAGLTVKALVDTGAACSLMAKRIFDALGERTDRFGLQETTKTLCGVGGAPLKVEGATVVEIDNVGPLRVLVVDDLAHDVIMGCDAIIEGQGQLDYVTDELRWHGERFSLKNYTNHQPHTPKRERERERTEEAVNH
jgi:hypothetical protein